MVENGRAKLLWDYDIRTDHRIQVRKPDLIVVNKENNKVTVTDVVIPWNTRVVEKSREKIEK